MWGEMAVSFIGLGTQIRSRFEEGDNEFHFGPVGNRAQSLLLGISPTSGTADPHQPKSSRTPCVLISNYVS